MKIAVYEWMKDECPTVAGFCELINETLKNSPNMTLEEFAREIHKENVIASYKRIIRAEKAQFGVTDSVQ